MMAKLRARKKKKRRITMHVEEYSYVFVVFILLRGRNTDIADEIIAKIQSRKSKATSLVEWAIALGRSLVGKVSLNVCIKI